MLPFDLETYPFGRANLAPRPVCGQWAPKNLVLFRDLIPVFEGWLRGTVILCGFNIAYDMACMSEHVPELRALIHAKYRAGQVQDLALNQKLVDIATKGNAKGEYGMRATATRYGIPMPNKDSAWRREFAALDGVPVEHWPAGAVAYCLDDVHVPSLIVDAMPDPGPLAGQEARKAFHLHLISCWGIMTDGAKVEALRADLQADIDTWRAKLIEAELVRPDGTKNTKAAMARMLEVMPDAERTKSGVCLDKEACEKSKDDILMMYSSFAQANTLMARVNDLAQGTDLPLQTRFNSLLETTRTSTSKPDLPLVGIQMQNFPRKKGTRECLVPRPGHCFLVCDLPMAELRSAAQNCIELGFRSVMAEELNKGTDLHAWFGARVAGKTYEEVLANKKGWAKDIRDRAKAPNFGFWGGLGARAFVDLAWSDYRILYTIDEADDLRETWLDAYPEAGKYFQYIQSGLNGGPGRCWVLHKKTGKKSKAYTVIHLANGMVRAKCTFNQAANTHFQLRTAVGASQGLCEISDLCYTTRESALWDSRVVAYQHDEIVTETPLDRMHEAGLELSAVLAAQFNRYHKDVPALPCKGPEDTNDPRCIVPEAALYYSKGLKTVWDERGRLTLSP